MRPSIGILLGLGVFFMGSGVAQNPFKTPVAEASISIEMSLDRLLERSHLVVVGTPVEAQSLWEPADGLSGRRIVTYSRLVIDRFVDGHLDRNETWVRTLGGKVDGLGQKVFGEAEVSLNQPALLFLRAREDGTHMVTGMAQGEFPLETAPDGTRRVRASQGLGALVPPVNAEATTIGAQRAFSGRGLDEVANLVSVRRRAIGVTK
jgi:hypothetical protein